jgi:hypothetical protein
MIGSSEPEELLSSLDESELSLIAGYSFFLESIFLNAVAILILFLYFNN